jgi:putative flavoprotein involved in K+ transport
MTAHVETVIIGGGQAGLAMSYCLRQLGLEHVVLERGRLAERWRSERWDSLTLLTPNWMTQLPGYSYRGDEPDGFMSRDEVVRFLEEYAATFDPPLQCGVQVASVRPQPGGERYLVQTDGAGFEARNVVVASGPYQQPSIPPLGARLPRDVLQLHSRDYRNPTQLLPGAVLVVGSGASGLQIVEDLSRSGRRVYVAVGRCNRWPRQYRGTDIETWMHAMGLLDAVGLRTVIDPKYGCFPVLTGVGGGHDLDYDRFAAEGVTLLGHLRGAEGGTLVFADDLRETLALWDESWVLFKSMIDAYIQQGGLHAPPDASSSAAASRAWRRQAPIRELDLAASGIATILWATGFRHDLGWLEVPVLDESGNPIHQRGVTLSDGVYFLGLRNLHKRKSSFLFGVGEDAAHLAEHIAARR